MAAAAVPLAAQRSYTIQVGAGYANGAGGAYVGTRSIDGFDLGVSVRIPSASQRVAFVMQGEIDGIHGGVVESVDCAIYAGHNGCAPSFPRLTGFTVSGGAMVAPLSRIELRALVGPGLYQGERHSALGIMGESDLTLFPLAHVGVAGGVKRVLIPHFRGDRLTLSGGFVGLRFRL